jgi:hypothetical protein
VTGARLTGIALLRDVIALLAALPDGGGETGARFAGSLAAYEAGAAEGVTLDACLDLVPPAGGVGWWTVERRQRRAALILELDRLMFPSLPRPSRYARARAIATRLRRFGSSASAKQAGPPVGPVKRTLWTLAGLDTPSGWRTIWDHLGGEDLQGAPTIGRNGNRAGINGC